METFGTQVIYAHLLLVPFRRLHCGLFERAGSLEVELSSGDIDSGRDEMSETKCHFVFSPDGALLATT